MDEQPVQLLADINIQIAATKNHARRVDYESGRGRYSEYFHVRGTTFDVAECSSSRTSDEN